MTQNITQRIRKVDGVNGLAVRARLPETDLDREVWAINLLTRKPKWSYETYNLLAYRRVLKVDGRIFFKGSRVRRLEGEPARDRELLLIVYYPNAMSFLRMVTHRIYRWISWFRIWGTSDLALDFAARLDLSEVLARFPQFRERGQPYLLHRFRCEPGTVGVYLPQIRDLAEQQGLKIFYAGEIVAHIEPVGAGLRTLPKPVDIAYDGLLLFKGADAGSLDRFYRGSAYVDVRKMWQGAVATIYSRIL